MLEITKRRNRSRTIAISYALWDKIQEASADSISVSSFIRMAAINELHRRGYWVEDHG